MDINKIEILKHGIGYSVTQQILKNVRVIHVLIFFKLELSEFDKNLLQMNCIYSIFILIYDFSKILNTDIANLKLKLLYFILI